MVRHHLLWHLLDHYTSVHCHNTVFDPAELEHVGQLAGHCLTELTPAWLMFHVILRYLVLISHRFVWRQAGLVYHRDCLPRRGRCSSNFGVIFDYGRHCAHCSIYRI